MILRLPTLLCLTSLLVACGGGGGGDETNTNTGGTSGGNTSGGNTSGGNTSGGSTGSGDNGSTAQKYRIERVSEDLDNNGVEDMYMAFTYDNAGRIEQILHEYVGDGTPDKVKYAQSYEGQIFRDQWDYDFVDATSGEVSTSTWNQKTSAQGLTSDTTIVYSYTYENAMLKKMDATITNTSLGIITDSTQTVDLMYDNDRLTEVVMSITAGGFQIESKQSLMFDASNRVMAHFFEQQGLGANQAYGFVYTYEDATHIAKEERGLYDVSGATPVLIESEFKREFIYSNGRLDGVRSTYTTTDANGGQTTRVERSKNHYHANGYVDRIDWDRDDDGTIDGVETITWVEATCSKTWNTQLMYIFSAVDGTSNELKYDYQSLVSCY